MKKIATFCSALMLAGSLFSASYAVAEQAPAAPQTQVVEQQSASVTLTDKVNINTATAAEIQKALIGLGAKKAQAVVEYREKHGNFTALEQLLEVQGIGKATLEKNRDRIAL
ncbi:ComEA family DNA-binding protein [Caviibacterium pharyngocola]|uniref:Competence protein ComE n=1 Tax=Caviibacterium pharyngocola TaxID=28159 RepID=A0A2M8RYE3_9PAST|nr:helix-hairpin-helix domain-containing protein [Caviibacterium pharyngocola]PJG83913.1 competence protein ComE [Caviibacterium pharyngocola]